MKSHLSVIILNWNTRSLLEKFLPLVWLNSRDKGVEIVVADNGSDDDSVLWVKENHPQIKVLELGFNFGFAEGYNRAISMVDSQFVLLLNSDVAPGENWIAPLLRRIKETPDCAAVVPSIKDYNNPEKFEYAGAAGGYIDLFGYPFCRGRIFDTLEQDDGMYSNPVEVMWGSGAALLVDRELFVDSGALDKDFFAHMEEIDWCWRVRNRGYSIWHEPESTVYHLGGGTLNYNNNRKIYLNFRNNLYLLVKNSRFNLLPATLLIRFALDYAAGFMFLFKGRFKSFAAIFKAHRDFIKRLPSLCEKRKSNLRYVRHTGHDRLIYKKSIVFDYFIKSKRKFSQLNYIKE
ncbi:glycosyltransferase family 2 protein [Marinilabiliaceae bacterium ANBcel2]|nr:glycosyltransferase family 2 protein [Marinilabiliaceae bacterium ANBcel2]